MKTIICKITPDKQFKLFLSEDFGEIHFRQLQVNPKDVVFAVNDENVYFNIFFFNATITRSFGSFRALMLFDFIGEFFNFTTLKFEGYQDYVKNFENDY